MQFDFKLLEGDAEKLTQKFIWKGKGTGIEN